MRFSKILFGADHSLHTSFSADIKVNKFDLCSQGWYK